MELNTIRDFSYFSEEVFIVSKEYPFGRLGNVIRQVIDVELKKKWIAD